MENKNNLIDTRKDAENGMFTDRSLEAYERYFNVKFAEMKGKRILDIGSGRGLFSKEASLLGLDVTSMSPELKNINSHKFDQGRETPILSSSVAARAQEMPFTDNSFDFEFAVYSIPHYLPEVKEEYEKCIDEIIRTLKINGKAYLYPVNLIDYKDFMQKKLEKESERVSFSPPTEENNRLLVLTKK